MWRSRLSDRLFSRELIYNKIIRYVKHVHFNWTGLTKLPSNGVRAIFDNIM